MIQNNMLAFAVANSHSYSKYTESIARLEQEMEKLGYGTYGIYAAIIGAPVDNISSEDFHYAYLKTMEVIHNPQLAN